MRTILYYIMLLICVATSATSCTAQTASSNKYVINGTYKGTDGDTLMLGGTSGRMFIPIDTIFVKNGKFTSTGEVEGAKTLFFLGLKDGRSVFQSMIVVESGTINVTLYDDANDHITVSGSEAHKEFFKVLGTENDPQYILQSKLRMEMNNPATTDTRRIQIKASLDSLQTIRLKQVADYIKANPRKKVSDLFLGLIQNAISTNEKQELVDTLSVNDPLYPTCQAVKTQLDNMNKFTDFTMPGLDGQNITVSDIVKANKYTLIDFWASWCGPCRMEMPNVKAAYDAYHGYGFEVVGVSLDSNSASWKSAVQSLEQNWIHVSDLKGWQCSAAQQYSVHSIPSNVLIDQNGRIIARDLRGVNLINTLAQLLGNKK